MAITSKIWNGSGYTITLDSSSTSVVGSDGNDSITGVTGTVVGGLGHDTITMTGYASVVGGDGNDTITLGAGTADGGSGNNTITASGWTTVVVGDGANIISIQGGSVTTGAGSNKITIGSGGATINSGLGNDTVTASGWSDIHTGGGADTISVVSGTIDSGTGDDVVTATTWSSIQTGDGNDTVSVTTGSISTGAGNDKITITPQTGTQGWTAVLAGDGDDAINITGSGAIDGGAGNDTVNIVLTGAAGSVNTVNLGSYHVNSTSSVNDIKGALSYANGQFTYNDTSTGQYLSLTNIENVNVTSGSNASDLVIDHDNGGGTYDGGGGSDAFYADWSSATTAIIWNGTAGNNKTIATNFERYLLQTGSGNDLINLTSIPSMGNDEIYTNAGNDTINGGLGADTMSGGDGSDVYYVESSGDVVIETNSNSTTGGVDTVYSSLASYTLSANVENGIISTTTASNITGNELNNTLTAGAGNNVINGGLGSDTASYLSATGGVTINLKLTGAQITTSSGSDQLTSIENITGSDYNDNLIGDSGNNILTGGKGNDILDGSNGDDTMIGGSGADTYTVDSVKDAIIEIAGDNNTDSVNSFLTSYVLPAYVEIGRIRLTTAANLTGNDLNNWLVANVGNNILDGGSGNDTVSYQSSNSAVTASLITSAAQNTGGSGIDTLLNIENLAGSNYADKLTGNAASNILRGGLGIDTLIGGDGSDTYYIEDIGDQITETATGGTSDIALSSLSSYTLADNVEQGGFDTNSNADLTGNSSENILYSNTGNNIFDGKGGADTASYSNAISGVTVSLAIIKIQNTISAGYDTLINIENLTGSNYSDNLTGNSVNNVINGGIGNDTLTGGAGNDVFVFSSLADLGLAVGLRDVITDFTTGVDRINISAIDANVDVAGDQAFNLVSSFSTAGGEVRYSGGVLYINTDHDIDAEYAIQFTGSVPSTLTAADLVL